MTKRLRRVWCVKKSVTSSTRLLTSSATHTCGSQTETTTPNEPTRTKPNTRHEQRKHPIPITRAVAEPHTPGTGLVSSRDPVTKGSEYVRLPRHGIRSPLISGRGRGQNVHGCRQTGEMAASATYDRDVRIRVLEPGCRRIRPGRSPGMLNRASLSHRLPRRPTCVRCVSAGVWL